MKLRLGQKTQKTLAIALPIQWVVFKLVSLASSGIESIYSNGIFKVISGFQKMAFGWIPFSIGQIVFYFLLAFFVWLLFNGIRSLKNEKRKTLYTCFNALAAPLSLLSIIYFFFMILWGFNYERQPLAESLKLKQNEIELIDLKNLAEELIEATNNSRAKATNRDDTCLVLSFKNSDYFKMAKQAFENLGTKSNLFINKNPSVKAVALPQLMSLFGLGGIYFPFTGEANVNMHQPDFKLPFTICHEMAHQVGVGSEAEANFVAYLACKASDDPVFNYSGNLAAMRYTLHAIHKSDSAAFNDLIITCNKGVLLDLEENTLYWERFETPINDFSRWINNLYLKSNGQPDGVLSYGKMVELMVWNKRTTNSKLIEQPYFPKTKDEIRPIIEKVSLPYKYTCALLGSITLDSTKTIHSKFIVVKEIAGFEHKIVLNKRSMKHQLFLHKNDDYETVDLCYSNNFGKIIIEEKATINADLSVEINATMLNCSKINDSLTVCDSIFDTQLLNDNSASSNLIP
ncbi:MAG: DUF3810 domain-containing protein [Bacteroidia bacterium]